MADGGLKKAEEEEERKKTGREGSESRDRENAAKTAGGSRIGPAGSLPEPRSARSRHIRPVSAIRTHVEPIHDGDDPLGCAAATVCRVLYGGLVSTDAP